MSIDILIHHICSGPFATNSYVVACSHTRCAAIIDPAPASFSHIVDCLEKQKLIPEKILLTHSHWDHFADAAQLKALYNIPLYVHKHDAGNVEDPGSDGLPLWREIERVDPDNFLQEGEVIPIGNIHLQVIHTPGHTPGGVCFYDSKNNVLFSGDTLFKGTIGNLSFPTANPTLMWQSLAKLAKLPPDTLIFPGHGEKTTIASEKWLENAEDLFG